MEQACVHHTMLSAIDTCQTCQRPFCDLCLMEIGEALYCSGDCFRNRSASARPASPARSLPGSDPLDGLEFTEIDAPSSPALPRNLPAAEAARAPSVVPEPRPSPGAGDWVAPWETSQESSAEIPAAELSPTVGQEESVILGPEHLLGEASDSSILEMPRRPGPGRATFEPPPKMDRADPSGSPKSGESVYLGPPPVASSSLGGGTRTNGGSPKTAVCIRHPEVQALGRCAYCTQLLCALCAEERPEGWVCQPACPESGTLIRRVPAAKKKLSWGLVAAGLAGPLLAAGVTIFLYGQSRWWSNSSASGGSERRGPALAPMERPRAQKEKDHSAVGTVPGARMALTNAEEKKPEPLPQVRFTPKESAPTEKSEGAKVDPRASETERPRTPVLGDLAQRGPRPEERPAAPPGPAIPLAKPLPLPAAAPNPERTPAAGPDPVRTLPKTQTPHATPPERELSPQEKDLREAARIVQEATPGYREVMDRVKSAAFQLEDVPPLLGKIESLDQMLGQAQALYSRIKTESPSVPGLDPKIEQIRELRTSIGQAVERLRVPRTLLHAKEQIRQATPLYKKVAHQWAKRDGVKEDQATLIRESEQAITMLWDARTLYESVLEQVPDRATLLQRIRVIDGLIRDLERTLSAAR